LSICGHFKEQFYHVGSSNCVTGEFDDLCARSSELAQQSNGAPMFTVAEKSAPPKAADSSKLDLEESVPKDPSSEDDWQMLWWDCVGITCDLILPPWLFFSQL
jgi:hypothetical protein